MRRFACLLLLLLVGATPSAVAGQFGTTVAMQARNGATFYVPGLIPDLALSTGWSIPAPVT
jgi:hypothetical protein